MSDAVPPDGDSVGDRDPTADAVEFSIGICAYNEERNIERCIRSIYEQELSWFRLKEVLVVSSGSTDGTDGIVRSLMSEHGDIVFLPQTEREGKNSAINLYLDNMTTGIAVMLNADNIFAGSRSLQSLLEPLMDPGVGIVGGHPIPTNEPSDKVGFASVMLWTMHHYIALQTPKIGELVAFRDIGTRLRTDLQSDEDIIRMRLEEAGYRGVYAPDATVYNHGPDTEADFIKQRVRVNVGEVTMRRAYGYREPSWNKGLLTRALYRTMRELGFHPFKMCYAAVMEMRARSIAKDHVRRGDDSMSCWDPVDSTKRVRSHHPSAVQDLARTDHRPVTQHRIRDLGAPAYPAAVP